MDDNFLVQQTLNGNKNAFRFLVLRYQKPIFKILSTLIFDKQLREEVAQETFLRAYKSLSSFDPSLGTSFSTWLFTISRNIALNELDKIKVRKAHSHMLVTESETPMSNETDTALEEKQKMNLVREAVTQLPNEFRVAVVLSCLEGHSIAEIAKIEECSEGTVKSRIFRGKQLLKDHLMPIFGENYEKNV